MDEKWLERWALPAAILVGLAVGALFPVALSLSHGWK